MGPPPTERERQRSHVPETGTANPFTYLEKKQIMNGTSKGTLWRGRARRVDRTTTRFVLLVAVAVHLRRKFRTLGRYEMGVERHGALPTATQLPNQKNFAILTPYSSHGTQFQPARGLIASSNLEFGRSQTYDQIRAMDNATSTIGDNSTN
jgi:hypothetical protein